MAHYAFLDEFNIVTEVICGVEETELIEGEEPEIWYGKFRNKKCKRTSYNGTIRKNYAGVGYHYDELLDAFISPKPYDSWLLNDLARWEAPIPMPNDLNMYFWDENNLCWVLWFTNEEKNNI